MFHRIVSSRPFVTVRERVGAILASLATFLGAPRPSSLTLS